MEAAKADIPAREKPVIFYDTPEGRGTPERMAILNKYRDAVANGDEIPYETNEDKLYKNMQAFASAMELDLNEWPIDTSNNFCYIRYITNTQRKRIKWLFKLKTRQFWQ